MMMVVKSISSFLVVLRLAAGVDEKTRKNFFVCFVSSSRGKSTHTKEGISAMTKIIFFRFSKTKPDETMRCE